MKRNLFQSVLAILSAGFLMWTIAGLWHNLVLPAMDPHIKAHHEGIFIMLIAYFILSFFVTYLYTEIQKKNRYSSGLKIGILVGILWVFPHGLAMAGAHGTSMAYEFQNAIWHTFEQGVGGLVVALIKGNESFF